MTPAEIRIEHTKAREWAKANGLAVGQRGRVSAEVLQAYRELSASSEPVAAWEVQARLGHRPSA